ncbi:MAG: hypothetical protein ABI831_11415 [Betaproteobacteria bacterium]
MNTLASWADRSDTAGGAVSGRTFIRVARATIRKGGNFIAGMMIGSAFWLPIFVAMEADPGDWAQTNVFGALGLFAGGWVLRAGINSTAKSGRTPRAKRAPLYQRMTCPDGVCTDHK